MSKIDNLQEELDNVLPGADVEPTEPDTPTTEEPGPEPGTVPAGEPEEEPLLGETYNGVAVPEKFQGQPVSKLIESYMGLEKRMGDPSRSNNARQQLKDAGVSEKALDKIGELDAETIKKIEAMDFTEMKPADFAKAMAGIIQANSQQHIQSYIAQQTQVQKTVRSEVAEASEEYPLLKSSPEFRQAVLNVVGSSEAQGQEMTLKEACGIVDGQIKAINQSMGYASPEKEAKKSKAKRTTVETDTPTKTPTDNSDETNVKNAILNAGQSMGSPIGGLG